MSRDHIADMLGIDLKDPVQRQANELVREEHALIDALVALRRAQGMTLADVAERVGCDALGVAEFEASGCEKSLSFVTRYAHAVGAMVTHAVTEWRP